MDRRASGGGAQPSRKVDEEEMRVDSTPRTTSAANDAGDEPSTPAPGQSRKRSGDGSGGGRPEIVVAMTERSEQMHCELPMTRIRKLIKTVPEMKKLSHEAAFLIAKSTEVFIDVLSTAGCKCMADNDKNELSYDDMALAVASMPPLDFLRDIVPTRLPAKEALKAVQLINSRLVG